MATLLDESLWGDEGFSAMAVQRPFWEMMGVVMRDTAPPLFYVLGWGWGRIFGFSEVALRSLSLLLIMGAAYFAFRIVWSIGRDRLAAVAAGTLAMVSPFLVPFAFEWRMYALFAFTVMASNYFFAARRWRGYIFFTAAALYTHHYALFTLAGQGIWYLLHDFDGRRWRDIHRQLWPFLAVAGLYLPWLYPFYLQLTRVQGSGFWLSVPSLGEVVNLLHRFVTGGVDERWRRLVLVLVSIILVGKRWKEVGAKWLELLLVFIIPIILSYTISYIITPIFFDRYLLSVVMGMMVLVVVGMRRWTWPALAVILAIFLATSIEMFFSPTKRPFRALAASIREERNGEGFLLNYNGKAHHLWESKYYGIEAPIFTPQGPLPLYVGTAQMEPEDTIQILPDDVERIGLITSDPVENVRIPEPWEAEEIKEFGELKVIWFSQSPHL